MSSMSRHHAGIVRSQLIDSFTEISCASAPEANRLLTSYPEYREAKSDPNHAFWATDSAQRMLKVSLWVERKLSSAQQVALSYCA